MINNRNYGCRITEDITIKGLKAVVMENEKLRITILVDKGTDVYEFLYKPLDIDFMWRSPSGLKSSTFISTTGNENITFFDRYEGGWQEILPNGGPACEYKGAIFGQHGEISNIPWRYIIRKDTVGEISVTFYVNAIRTPFYIEKTLTLKTNDPALYIDETLVNESKEDMDLMWGHHPAIGAPFLSKECIIKTSAKKVIVNDKIDFDNQRLKPSTIHNWPRVKSVKGDIIDLSIIQPETANTADMLYLTDFNDKAWYELYNKTKDIGFGMEWDKALFKYLWMWQVSKGSYGYPWYGRIYTLALEPWTSYPSSGLTTAVKNGSALKMLPDQKITTSLKAFIHEKI